MQYSSLYALTLLLLLLGSCAASNWEINFEMLRDVGYPDQCVVLSTNGSKVIVNSGREARHPNQCARIICGLEGWALIYTCLPISVPQNCLLGGYKNYEAEFPKCCKRHLECNEIK